MPRPYCAWMLPLVLLCASLPAWGAVHEVEIVNFQFNPSVLNIAQGDSVHWTNSTATVHTVTSGTDCSADGIFDSGNLGQAGEFGRRFTGIGSFPYFCIPHCASQGMTGSVEVSENTPSVVETWGKIKVLYQ